MEFVIRPYKDADKEACVAAFRSNIPEYFATHELPDFEEWLTNKAFGDHTYFYVLETAGALIACGGFGYEAAKNEVRFIWGLVNRFYHKKGWGKRLFEFRINEIKKKYPGIPIRLDTTQQSHGFFKKLGFKVDKITKDFYAPGFDRYDMTLNSF